ncbi:hypothetical protein PMAYCL1PPCAC_25453, partial [Pristionchus mayeri]
SDLTVLHILKLADRFQMEKLKKECEKHIMKMKGFDMMKKLILSDQFQLAHLRNECIYWFKSLSANYSKMKKSSTEYANLSAEMKDALE